MPRDTRDYGPAESHLYDSAYAILREPSGDASFYRALAREAQGPVLELGCGSGRVLLPIGRDGIECMGLDASREMLERFREKGPPSNLTLVEGRMENFDLRPRRFRLVYSAFRAFQHLLDVEDQLACLAAVHRHLMPGGRFAFDVFSPRLDRIALESEPEAEDVRFADPSGEEVVRFVSLRRDRATQRQVVTFRYERRPREGGGPESVVAESSMRWFFRYEVEHLLARAGFGIENLYGNFDRTSYTSQSPEMIFVSRKSEIGNRNSEIEGRR
jgi:SAM-dependent methyltransferase